MILSFGLLSIKISKRGHPMRQIRRHRRTHTIENLEFRRLLSTYYVDANAPGTTQNGSSWELAFKDLQSILTKSTLVSGDTIKVADGTYKPTAGTDRSVSFNLKKGVGIFGGYAGYGANDPNARDTTLYPTILSGDIGTIGANFDNSYHVVTVSQVNSSTILDGVTITLGNANGTGTNESLGGGMLNLSNSTPTLNNCTFSENTASSGGGIYNLSSSPTLTNCSFSGNIAYLSYGGGIYNLSSSPTLTNCSFSGNNSSSSGGGMYNASSSPILSNCSFSGNTACDGAGICNNSSSPTLANCSFTGNTVFSSGGGMYNASSSPIFSNCSFTGNTASSGGGMCNNNSSSPTLTNCSFTGNKVSSYGGGIYNRISSPTLINCTFTGNTGRSIGAICNDSSSPTLTNCILWNNGLKPIYNYSSSPTITYCDIQGGYPGIGNIDVDPCFVRSFWIGPDGDGDFGTADNVQCIPKLNSSSPCLNAGLNSANSTSSDLAGNPRVQNDIIDMGAYEGGYSTTTKTLYVDINAIGDNSGSSWTNAFANLQSAILAASDGDTIQVADGTYKPTATTNRKLSFVLKNAVTIQGGYAGVGAADPNVRNTTLYPTILSGDIGVLGNNSDNSNQVVIATSVGPLTVLDGITIAHGNANMDAVPDEGGGGINCSNYSSPLFKDCVFTENTSNYGGGLKCSNSSPILTNCVFKRNTSSTFGAGIHNVSSSPILINCVFSGNSSSNYGGGISNDKSSPTLYNCLFIGNSTFMSGGGIYNSSSSPNLANCTFFGNTLLWSAENEGGGGVHNYNSSPVLTNCILWNNGPTPFYNYVTGTSTPTVAYCDINGGYTGTGNISADPCFVRTPWVGPDGAWGTADDDYGDLRLRSTSPCINAGLNSANSTTIDLAGNPRKQNGIIDLGAYEGSFNAPNPKTYYVDILAIGDNSGSSWTNAFTSLQSAIIAAADGDTIKVAGGTYKPTPTTDKTISFQLRNTVMIYGGYAGSGAEDPETRNTMLYPTVLSGDIGIAGAQGDNSYHVVGSDTVGAATVLNGFTITLGNATFQTVIIQSYYGGGMRNISSSPTLINCIFTGNTAYSSGGGIYNDDSSPTLINCIFSGNSAGGGGGICNSDSSPTLTNCIFSGNSADYGGGIDNAYLSSPTLTNCIFSGNSATKGGAIYNSYSNPIITNCILWGNSTSIYISSSAPTLAYCDIQGGYTGTGNIDADPLFVRNPSPGADGKWGTADDNYGDLRLQIASPCINAGLNSANTTTTDLAGNPRIIDSTIDLGGYESAIPSFIASNSSIQISFSNKQIVLSNSAGQTILRFSASTLNLSNIQSLLIQNASADNLALSPTQLTLNTANINLASTPILSLANPALNSLSLSGNVSLKLASPNLVVNSGSIPTLRSYLTNAATGAKPSIVCDSVSTLALIDNFKLHKTSFAGVTLSAPFSQLLIRPATPGDANLDGVVNVKDLLSIFANLNQSNATWLSGDVDQSGTVDLADLAIVQSKLSSPAISALSVQKSLKKSPVFQTKNILKHKTQIKHK